MTFPSAIHVVGAGAIGTFLAVKLHEAGLPVTVVARGERLLQISRDGCSFVDAQGAMHHARIGCAERLADAGKPDFTILATKAAALPRILDNRALHSLGQSRALLTVQNGVEAPWLVRAGMPDVAVVGSRVHGFFEMEGDVVRHKGVLPHVLLGGIDEASHAAAYCFTELFNVAGIGVDLTDDIASVLWEKLLLAGSVGAVATACSVPVGTLLADPQRRATLQAAMEKVSSVAAARNVRLPGDLVPKVMSFVESFPPDVTSSLQRDLETGQPSEYDALVGIALRWAEDAGVAVPTLRSVDGMIRRRGLL